VLTRVVVVIVVVVLLVLVQLVVVEVACPFWESIPDDEWASVYLRTIE